jgi:quercetin dioxygenase-like cupin family protein
MTPPQETKPMGADATETPRERARHVTDHLIDIDLAAELKALRASDAYQTADHAAKMIAKHPGLRVLLMALKPGGKMHEHHADGAITVQGVDGHVEFKVGESAVALTRGRLLTVAAGVPHSVIGVDESALLLTMGGAHGGS